EDDAHREGDGEGERSQLQPPRGLAQELRRHREEGRGEARPQRLEGSPGSRRGGRARRRGLGAGGAARKRIGPGVRGIVGNAPESERQQAGRAEAFDTSASRQDRLASGAALAAHPSLRTVVKSQRISVSTSSGLVTVRSTSSRSTEQKRLRSR